MLACGSTSANAGLVFSHLSKQCVGIVGTMEESELMPAEAPELTAIVSQDYYPLCRTSESKYPMQLRRIGTYAAEG